MAEIKPFRAVHYNRSVVGDLKDVICPPYDIISPQLEDELYRRSKYNFVRIEHNRQLPQDSDTDNRYTRSGEKLNQWLQQGVLVAAEKPAFYIHEHHFSSQGRRYRRRGLVARVKIEEWHKNIIRPHEGTLAEAKSDRINLLEAIKANTSPIMTLYEDREKRTHSLLESTKKKRLLGTQEDNAERHEIWQLDDAQAVKAICDSFAEKALYIADGHHRYESALKYKRQLLAGSAVKREDAPFNYIMMTLVAMDDPGLVILPPHRLLRGLPESKLDGLAKKLKSFFEIERLPLDATDLWQAVDRLLTEGGRVKLAVFGIDAQNLLIITLRDAAAADRMIPYFHSDIYKRLDVSIVDHIVLEELLGLSSHDEVKIAYNFDRRDAVSGVLNGEYQLAFIVSPVKAGTIKAIADAGDRMPRKSTYFYPKLPSGLIINRLT